MSLLFALVPLLEIRRVKPLLLLREETAAPARRSDARPGGATGGASRERRLDASASRPCSSRSRSPLLASWQAASWRVGLIVSGGFISVAIVLFVAGAVLVWAVRPLSRVRWFPLRHAIIGFGRPGHQTRVILLAVGLGSFFISACGCSR